MPQTVEREPGLLGSETNAESDRIVLGLLNSVEEDGAQSQRRLAAELGIALGLVNAYLKRCVSKGLLKVGEAPARRYAYYLTPKGFTEKSRLTVEYLSSSFSFFRRAKSDCSQIFRTAKSHGFTRMVLAGKSDLAEIAMLCSVEAGVEVVAVVDPRHDRSVFIGVELVSSYDEISNKFDAIVVTDLVRTRASLDAAIEAFGEDRVFVPELLGLKAKLAGRAGEVQ
ncbi:MAG: winged helix-turn-helix transcriptional regulator [Afipia sp.]